MCIYLALLLEKCCVCISECPLVNNQPRYSLVQQNAQTLMETIPANEMMLKLFTKNAVNKDTFARVKRKTPQEKNHFIVMDIVLGGTNRTYDAFVEALKELNCDALAQLITGRTSPSFDVYSGEPGVTTEIPVVVEEWSKATATEIPSSSVISNVSALPLKPEQQVRPKDPNRKIEPLLHERVHDDDMTPVKHGGGSSRGQKAVRFIDRGAVGGAGDSWIKPPPDFPDYQYTGRI